MRAAAGIEHPAGAWMQAHARLRHRFEQACLRLGLDRDQNAPDLRMRDDLEVPAQLVEHRVVDVVADVQADDALRDHALDAGTAQVAPPAQQIKPVGCVLVGDEQAVERADQPRDRLGAVGAEANAPDLLVGIPEAAGDRADGTPKLRLVRRPDEARVLVVDLDVCGW